MKSLIVDKKYDNKKLSNFILDNFKDLSYNNFCKKKKKKDIRVNDVKVNSNVILKYSKNVTAINLTELILSNLSYNDLINLINAFKKNKDIFPVLMNLDISLGIFAEDYKNKLEILLKESLPQKLKHFFLNLPFNITTTELIDILYWIKLNHNNELKIHLKIIQEEMTQHIHKCYLINLVNESFKKNNLYLKQRHLLLNYKANEDNNIIIIEMNKYKEEELNNYYSIIYCLNKHNSKITEDKNKRIFENIFDYKGSFRKYNVFVEYKG